MLKRMTDILFSFAGLLVLSPLFLVLSVAVALSSKGGVFFLQTRVGKNNKDFKVFKFRTMHTDSDKKGLLTVGGHDPRITRVGYFLRKYKLDELPQLFNVLSGSMSLVGPRPEVRKYVDLYDAEQTTILKVKPGITDYASLEYFNENELLANSADPEQTYISEVMPAKLRLNRKYIEEAGFGTDMKIIFGTIRRIFNSR